ncbi:MAG: radical SAM protein [Candidatus Omnitrophica bacterium]|nr:radical SAM protein [Candidatus Omnitrophota bacterium]
MKKTLVLVEPFLSSDLIDRPHLGIAMLAACCRQQGIDVRRAYGQADFIKDMFLHEADDVYEMMRALKGPDAAALGLSGLRERIRQKGRGPFRDELRSIYETVYIQKSARNFLDAGAIGRLRGYARAFLRAYAHQITAYGREDVLLVRNCLRRIKGHNPDYVGFSLAYDLDPFSRQVRRRLSKGSGLIQIAGGSLTPFLKKDDMGRLLADEHIDYLLIGESEASLPMLINSLSRGSAPDRVDNLVYLRGNTVHVNERSVIKDLDALPFPDFTVFNLDEYPVPEKMLPIQTSRGCSWRRCRFCHFDRIYSGTYREFSARRVVSMIRYLRDRYDCRHFAFNNEEITASQAVRLSKTLVSLGMKDLFFFSAARADGGFNSAGKLRLLRKAGFRQIHWGIESGSQRVLDLMDKGINLSEASCILRKAHACGIGNVCFIMFGFPGERKRDAQNTVSFLKRHSACIQDISLGAFEALTRPLPGKENLISREGLASMRSFIGHTGLNSDHAASAGIRFLPPGDLRFALSFFNLSYGILGSRQSLKMLNNERRDFYPALSGRMSERRGRYSYMPVNLNENYFINFNVRLPRRPVNDLEKEVFFLSDGLSPIYDIIKILRCEYGGASAEKGCRDFLREAFKKGWGIAYKRPWAKGVYKT